MNTLNLTQLQAENEELKFLNSELANVLKELTLIDLEIYKRALRFAGLKQDGVDFFNKKMMVAKELVRHYHG